MIKMKKFTVRPRITHAGQITIGSLNGGNEKIYLGRLAETGQLTRLDFDVSNPHVVAIFGKRGSGKSYTLGGIIEGLCTKQNNSSISAISRNQAILLFDTLGIFQWMDVPLSLDSPQELVREQASYQKGWDLQNEPLDIKIWTPSGTPSGLRQYDEFTINCADFTASDWGYLFGLDILQDRMGQLISDAYEKVVNEGWADGLRTYDPQPRYAIEDLMDCIQSDVELNNSYHSETKRAVLQQLSIYWRNPLFQPKRRVPTVIKSLVDKGEISQDILKSFESLEGVALPVLLKPGQLSILLLHKLSEELRFVIIVALIRKIMESRIITSELEKSLKILPKVQNREREAISERISHGIPPTWIVADEAQNFLPSERKTTATEVLVRLVREGRNVGLSFVLTTQQPYAIDQRILSQADTIICHKLTVQGDIEYVKRNWKSALPENISYGNTVLSLESLLRTLDIGQSIISNTEAERTFIIDVRPRISVHGGFGV